MIIHVPRWALTHFWQEPPPGHMEFWAFRYPPHCRMGEEIIFQFDGRTVARAEVSFVEAPGKSWCHGTGKFARRWKVFWHPDTFRDLRPDPNQPGNPGPLFEDLPQNPKP